MRTALAGLRPSSRVGIVALAVLAGCSGKPGTGGLEVIVDLEPGLISRCVKVTATDGTTTKETKPMVVGTKTSLQVAIYSDGFASSVTVQALGYVDVECTMLSGEVSAAAEGTFGNPPKSLTLTVRPTGNGDGGFNPDGGPDAGADAGADAGVDAGVDAGADAGIDNDNDGSPLPADCDDTNPAIRPGALEVCDNATDDDCDSLADCEQPVCNGFRCSATGLCMGTTCIGPDESPCNDGLDNNGNGLIDCADPGCTPGSSCSDRNACTTGDQCVVDGGCEKTGDVMCTTPPNGGVCYGAAGSCLPDAGASCQYTPLTGGGCNDQLGCTTGDTCNAGACEGTQVTCPLPSNACLSPVGICQEPSGTCFNAPRPAGTGTCSDGVACTINDTCNGAGGCAGTAVSCTTPPTQCHGATTGCDVNGACLYGSRNGLACDAGTGGAATCVGLSCTLNPTSRFPYVPGNFAEAQLPATDGGITFSVTCQTTINTGGTPSISSTCGMVMPPSALVTPAGGESTLLLAVDSLTVNSGQALIIEGARPVIFAVLGNVSISGTVRARNAGTPAECGNGGNGGATMGLGGGGGGGFGSAGAVGGIRTVGGGGTLGGINGVDTLLPLRGGCRGGNGSGTGGTGGAGGGAIQLSATGSLTVTSSGVVSASGLGGAGATGTDASGGGGGSGGGVLLEALSVQLNSGSWLTANGGAGGGGEDGANGGPGENGSENSATAAQGGTANNNAGPGGRGATQTTTVQPGSPTATNDGAGGGGAGMGRIRINASGGCTIDGASNSSPTAIRPSCP